MTTPDRTRVTVEIYGTSYKLVGSNTDYMKQVANYVDERMHSISQAHSRLDMPRIAVLAAVHMAEEAVQIQEIQSHMNRLAAERAELRGDLAQLQTALGEQQQKIQICINLLFN
uniref:Cell division protein ZapA n=1 Tax=Paenibacillus polymyxa TaxID=1406 RepID=A0AAE9PRB4_PAEPO